jgi:hypothetical protein
VFPLELRVDDAFVGSLLMNNTGEVEESRLSDGCMLLLRVLSTLPRPKAMLDKKSKAAACLPAMMSFSASLSEGSMIIEWSGRVSGMVKVRSQ